MYKGNQEINFQAITLWRHFYPNYYIDIDTILAARPGRCREKYDRLGESTKVFLFHAFQERRLFPPRDILFLHGDFQSCLHDFRIESHQRDLLSIYLNYVFDKKFYLVTNKIDFMKVTLKKRSLISAGAWTDPQFSIRNYLYWFRSECYDSIIIFAKIFENKFSTVPNDQTANRNASVEQDWSFFNNQIIWAIFRVIPWN